MVDAMRVSTPLTFELGRQGSIVGTGSRFATIPVEPVGCASRIVLAGLGAIVQLLRDS